MKKRTILNVWSWKTTVKTSKSSFKSFCITALLLIGLSANSFGQGLAIFPNTKRIEGGKDGKEYIVTFIRAVEKRQLVNDFIALLDRYKICDKKEAQSRIDEIDDKSTDFKINFSWNNPMFLTRMYGISAAEPALRLSGVLYFQFKDSIVDIYFKNWKEETFLQYYEPNQNFDAVRMGKAAEDPVIAEWQKYYNEKITQNTILYKAFAVSTSILFTLDPTVDKKQLALNIQNALDEDYNSNWGVEGPMYAKLENIKRGKWFSDEEYVEYYKNTPITLGINEKSKKQCIDLYTSLINEKHELLALTETRWEKQVRPWLVLFFKKLAFDTESNIVTVAETINDVNFTTYCNINGMLLPADPKWPRTGDGTPIVPSDPKILDKYIKSNIKNQY